MPFLPFILVGTHNHDGLPTGQPYDRPSGRVTRPLHPAPGAVMAAPRAMPGPVMPGVRRTPGRPRGGDAPGGPDLPPCAGYSVSYTTPQALFIESLLSGLGHQIAA